MTTMLQCISPIDGSVFAERNTHAKSEDESIIETAKRAQKEWQSKPLQDRIDIVLAGIKAVEDMGNEKLVQDLAKMMGRPVRYG